VLLLTVATNNVSGATKKATVNGAIWIGYNVGNIASSYSVIASEVTVKYRSAWITVLACMAFTSVASIVLRYIYIRENKRRDALGTGRQGLVETPEGRGGAEKEMEMENGPVELEGQMQRASDLTDKERPEFRYTL
jgi:hypothetical protein